MPINGNEVKVGDVLEYQNSLWRAVKCSAVKPGKGGAYNQVELKNLFDGRKLNERFRASENVEKVRLEQVKSTYLYLNGDILVFMEDETYEQVELPNSFFSETQLAFLEENMHVELERYEEKYIGCKLPANVTCEISETEPALKGQTATSSFKPAILDNGVRVGVPPFVNIGDKIIVSTELVEYVKRAE